jgi:hypothetical protein
MAHIDSACPDGHENRFFNGVNWECPNCEWTKEEDSEIENDFDLEEDEELEMDLRYK